MGIPTEINDLTLKQFIEFTRINEDKNIEALDRKAELIKYFTGLDPETLPLADFHKYSSWIDLLIISTPSEKIHPVITVAGKKYASVTDVARFNVNQYTALQEFIKGGAIANLNKIASLCFYRQTDKPTFDSEDRVDIEKELLNAKVSDVHGTVFFYSKVMKTLSPFLEIYFLSASRTIQEMMKEIEQEFGTDFEKVTAGTMS